MKARVSTVIILIGCPLPARRPLDVADRETTTDDPTVVAAFVDRSGGERATDRGHAAADQSKPSSFEVFDSCGKRETVASIIATQLLGVAGLHR